jgi:hypothetical protein
MSSKSYDEQRLDCLPKSPTTSYCQWLRLRAPMMDLRVDILPDETACNLREVREEIRLVWLCPQQSANSCSTSRLLHYLWLLGWQLLEQNENLRYLPLNSALMNRSNPSALHQVIANHPAENARLVKNSMKQERQGLGQ